MTDSVKDNSIDEAKWLNWLAKVMLSRPENSSYLNSERGIEIGELCIQINRELHSWRRADTDTFWIDVQLYTKYKLSDDDITFIEKHQPGTEQYFNNAKERNAYAEMLRGMSKLRDCLAEGEE